MLAGQIKILTVGATGPLEQLYPTKICFNFRKKLTKKSNINIKKKYVGCSE